MKNTHLEHPEDSILSGDLTALDWMIEKNSHDEEQKGLVDQWSG